MTLAAQFPGDVVITGDLSIGSVTLPAACVSNAALVVSPNIERTKLAQDALAKYSVPWHCFKKNDMVTPLPTAGDSTNLGLVAGTHGTASPMLAGAGANGNSKTETARFSFTLPPEYDAGQTVTLRCHARVDVVANTSATLDVQCFESNTEAGISAELYAGAALTINSATWANKDFSITVGSLTAGDVLDVELTTIVNDTGGGGTCKANIGLVQFLLDIRG